MPMMTLDELDRGVVRLLVYGPPGTGKTYLLGSALEVPEMRPMVWFECDGGIVTIREQLRAHWDAVKVRKLETQADVDWMLKVVEAAATSQRIKTIAIDSMTELYTLLLNLKLAQQGRAGQTPQLQDYGAVNGFLLDFLRRMARMDHVNFLVAAGEKLQNNELTGEMHIYPDITGQLSTRAARYFHIVGYLTADIKASSDGQIRSSNRTLWVQPYNRVYAKDRTPGGLLGAAVHDPTAATLYAAINAAPPTDTEGEDGPVQATLAMDEESAPQVEALVAEALGESASDGTESETEENES